ncbi:MAG: HAMP domain-containing sensor histidine kinase [Desulfomonilaceae bacterium]|jgi:signal transduction histidine kinase
MKPDGPEMGIVFSCDLDGTIQEVIQDGLGLSDRMHPGKPLSTIVDRGSLIKSLNFIVEIKSHGAVFGWQLGMRIFDSVEILSFAGVLWNERLLIIGAKTTDGLEKLLNEMVQMGAEQINSLRSAMKDREQLVKNREQTDSTLYDELGRLNNELANLQREVTKKNVELEKLNEEKNRFLGIAAHDLRNPLNAIQIYSEFLLDEAADALNQEQMGFVSIIHSSSRFMLQLVNDLLDVAKIESGKLELELANTDLIGLIERNLVLNNAMASKKQIRHTFNHDAHIPNIQIDAAKIEQVLNNLITNALKFSSSGSVINVNLVRTDDEVILSVKDQGQGIPANDLDKLFKPFQRTSVKTTDGEESTGLGLAIVRKIVLGHKGRVWVKSEVGRGTTFYVALPLSPAK